MTQSHYDSRTRLERLVLDRAPAVWGENATRSAADGCLGIAAAFGIEVPAEAIYRWRAEDALHWLCDRIEETAEASG